MAGVTTATEIGLRVPYTHPQLHCVIMLMGHVAYRPTLVRSDDLPH